MYTEEERDPTHVVCATDLVDTDNQAQVLAAVAEWAKSGIAVSLLATGRPVNLGATNDTPIGEWYPEQSRRMQQISAARYARFLEEAADYGLTVYDGGIAPSTMVKHSWHAREDIIFFPPDVDHTAALESGVLRPIGELAEILRGSERPRVLVGGPLTGLDKMMTEYPDVEYMDVYAMLATWGNVSLMSLGDEPRGARQFNAVCDPGAVERVLSRLSCRLTLVSTDSTRVSEIGFPDPSALRELIGDSKSAEAFMRDCTIWYENALRPRKEPIYIHDVSVVMAASSVGDQIYDIVPVELSTPPLDEANRAKWGEIYMRQVPQAGKRFAALPGLKPGGAEAYMQKLREYFAG